MKRKSYLFSGYKQGNKASLVYLKCKLQRDRYGWWILKLKCQKTVERIYLETSKEETRYR